MYGKCEIVILLGVNDGLIPKTPSSTSLLSDMDRDKMDALGVELKAYGEERLLMEQETLYRALACPTDELLLTYHTIDAGGGETRPSYFVNTVRELLPDVPFSTHRTETVRDRLQAERPAVELACAYLSATGQPPCGLPMTTIRMMSESKTRRRSGAAEDR